MSLLLPFIIFISPSVYNNYEKTIEFINKRIDKKRIQPVVLGTSGSKKIWGFMVKGRNSSKTAMVIAGIHSSSEPSTTIVAINLLLLYSVKNPPKQNVLIIPVLNAGTKNRYNWRSNHRKVDLNRNFPSGWKKRYNHGKKPLSETESKTIYRLFKKLKPTLVVDLHQYGYEILLPHRRFTNRKSRKLAKSFKSFLNWRVRHSRPRGTLIDTAAAMGAAAVLLELGGKKSKRWNKWTQKKLVPPVVSALYLITS